MRILTVLISLFSLSVSQAQSIEFISFIGNDVMFTNGVQAHGINHVDTLQIKIDIEGKNYFGLENLNEYRISFGRMNKQNGYKLSYMYSQENVFVKHNIQFGLQKQIGAKLYTNLMLGTEQICDLNRQEYDLVYGISLRYILNDRIGIHQGFKKYLTSKRINNLENHTALLYKLSNQFAALAQFDYTGDFTGKIGLLLTYKTLSVQCTHQFAQNRIELGIGYRCSKFNFNVLYSYHDILGGVSYTRIQFTL